jgi:hypothetical protein
VDAFMAAVAALPAPPRAIDPMQLWWKAQLLRRWDARRRAQAPLDIMHPIEIAAGLVSAGLLVYWSLPLLF